MQLLTKELREQLLANGRQQAPIRGTDDEIDFFPVVKLFTPDAGATWLLTEIDPEEPDLAFGLPIERDLHFVARKSLSAYAEEASEAGHIRA